MRIRSGTNAAIAAALLALPATASRADRAPYQPAQGSLVVPESSIERVEDQGRRAHTNYRYYPTTAPATTVSAGPPYAGFLFETPASLACIYGVVAAASGCDPNLVATNSAKGGKVIAIVGAYDDPNAAADLKAYSTQFGLPAPNFQVVYATGTEPATDPTGGWEGEDAADIEMAHALAPGAKIILVECATNLDADLYTGVQKAASLVAAAGGGEVSMSWGGAEYSSETADDANFAGKNVVFLAAAGDTAGVEYPAASPDVVSVGGTTIRTNPNSGAFIAEAAWELTGGGASRYEPMPAFQTPVKSTVGAHRGVPDVAASADPNYGVWVYNSYSTPNTPWYAVGGTSVAVQIWTGIINAAGKFAASTAAEQALIYAATSANYTDIAYGICGPWAAYTARPGWDFCTGEGSAIGLAGK
jgi:subtilase family serine protease